MISFLLPLFLDVPCERARELCTKDQIRNALSVCNVHKSRQRDLCSGNYYYYRIWLPLLVPLKHVSKENTVLKSKNICSGNKALRHFNQDWRHISSEEAIDSVLEGKAKKKKKMNIIICTSFLLFRADCRANSLLLKGLTIHKNVYSSL